jgi:hypothetical protein
VRDTLDNRIDPTSAANRPTDGASILLKVKKMLMQFIVAVEAFELPTQPLTDLVVHNVDGFVKCVTHRFQRDLQLILSNERFEPLTINNEAEFTAYVVSPGLILPGSEIPTSFPTTMPFSLCVPLVLRLAKALITDVFSFSLHIKVDLAGYYFKLVSSLLSDHVNRELRRLVSPDQKHAVSVSQAVQFALNASFFARACTSLHTFMMTFVEVKAGEASVPQELAARYSFKATQTICTQLITRILLNKIDVISSVAEAMEWRAVEPEVCNSDYATDVAAYLRTTFSCMIFLTHDVKSKIYKQCFEHVADNIIAALVNEVSNGRYFFVTILFFNFSYFFVSSSILGPSSLHDVHLQPIPGYPDARRRCL